MKAAIFISLFIAQTFLCTLCFAQRQRIESLRKLLPSLRDSLRVDCLNALSESYLKFNSPAWPTPNQNTIGDTAANYASLAYKEALKLNYIHGIAESLSYKGQIEQIPDNFPAEEKFCREAINWFQKTSNKKRLAEAHFYLSHSLYAQSRFIEAIKNLDTAFECFKKSDDVNGMYFTRFLASWIYHESGDYEKAFEMVNKCLDISKQNKNDWLIRRALENIGWLCVAVENYEMALLYFRQTSNNDPLSLAELFTHLQQYDSAKYYYNLADTSDLRGLRSYLESIGEYFFAQKKYDKALLNFIRALNYHRQLNDINPVMQTSLNISKTYLALGNDDSAFKYGIEILSLSKQTGAKQFIKDASKILSSIYDDWQRPDSAYFYYKQYRIINDSVLNDQIKGKLAAYSFNQKIELLNNETEIRQAQLQQQSLLKNILIGSIIILLLLAAFIFRNILLKRKNEKQQLEHKHELQQLETKLESQQALLNERLRISRELHDDIGSTLGSISIYSEVAKKSSEEKENPNEVLSKIGLASRELIDKMSDIVWSLNPNNENFEQLQNRMMTFAAMMLAPRNIPYHFTANESLKKIQLTGAQRKNIFLVFKEALHNIIKYANCKMVSIKMSIINNALIMTIRDDGNGFDTRQINADRIISGNESLGGNGVKNMHARADDIHAKLCISSKINEGTTVQLIVHF